MDMTNPQKYFNNFLLQNPNLVVCEDDIVLAFNIICESYKAGGKLLLCGNGGSAADCEHIVGELMKGFRLKRHVKFIGDTEGVADIIPKLQGALPAISLTGHPSLATAFQNDVDPYMVFAQLVYGYGCKGDALLGISTSGNAENVCNALKIAKVSGIKTIGLTGSLGGNFKDLCDVCICVPAVETYLIQEMHLPVYHALCAMLELEFFSEE